MQNILLASGNEGKIAEIQERLLALSMTLIPQKTWGIREAEETGTTFVENAIIKARHAAQYFQGPVLADDSGLVVDALNGAPGVYSSRFGGEGASARDRIDKVLCAVVDTGDLNRHARFHCVLVLMRNAEDPAPWIFQGVWEGTLLWEPRGDRGFGYDPIFYVPTHHCSAAELDETVKNTISHRGQALQQLVALLEQGREVWYETSNPYEVR